MYAAWAAASAGLIAGVSAGTVIDGFSSTAWDTGVTNRTFATGDVITAQGTGYQKVVAVANRDTAIGSVIPGSGSNADFTILAVYAAVYTGINKWQGRKQKQWGGIWKSVFGSRARSVLGVWLLDSVAAVRERLTFENSWSGIDEYAPSAYASSMLTYNGGTWHGNYSSNQAQFVTDYISRLQDEFTISIDRLVTMKNGVENGARATDGIPLSTAYPQMIAYEAGNHMGFLTTGISDTAAMRSALEAANHDSRMATAWADYFLTPYKNKIGGLLTIFNDYEKVIINGGQIQLFGMLEDSIGGRTGMQTYSALSTFAAANP
jgi:hypothetical protein